ncbi:type IV pilus modification PilV family protein [Orenia marismortui]|uniref:type IV pilus modification PilV family protein n=1 Tax=Orenia marismortui TaxID=46469 RepID=UPI000369888F|nr:type II secretion system protein [Orenia marismortui]
MDYNDEKGFTLLEVILATALLGIIGVSFSSYWSTSTSALEDIHLQRLAREIAYNSVEQLQKAGDNLDEDDNFDLIIYNSISKENENLKIDGVSFSKEVSASDYQDGVKEINIKVRYNQSQVNLSLLLADKRELD